MQLLYSPGPSLPSKMLRIRHWFEKQIQKIILTRAYELLVLYLALTTR